MQMQAFGMLTLSISSFLLCGILLYDSLLSLQKAE